MPDAYRRSDILAVPSVQAPDGDRDGLPNVAVEAMACGLPVVGSRFAGIPEAVEHERTGLLVPPGDDAALADALHRMSTDAELRTLCAGRARQLVETKFNAARNAQQVYDAIRAVVERKTVPSTEC
jgi:glycosyltransferase involved in cell wall biosynthesis